MQTADLPQFELELARLFASWDKTLTEARKSTYFTGLTKMSLAQFRRCVDIATGEEGPEDLPTPRGIWKIHSQGRTASTAVQTSAKSTGPDHLEYIANRLLYGHLIDRGGVGAQELAECQRVKRELVTEFCSYVREGDVLACPHEFLRRFTLALDRVSKLDPLTIARWRSHQDHPQAFDPYPPAMARELRPAQQESLV